MKIIILISSLLFAGCATTKNYEKILDGWIGVNADQLVWTWGPPSGVYDLHSGDKMLSYFSSAASNSYTVVNRSLSMASTYSSSQYCKTFFISDKKNVITAWHWQGTDCKAIVRPTNSTSAQPVNGWSKPQL